MNDTIVNGIIRARATIHLPGGIVPGRVYEVDSSSPYVLDCLAAGYLVDDETESRETAVTGMAADDT